MFSIARTARRDPGARLRRAHCSTNLGELHEDRVSLAPLFRSSSCRAGSLWPFSAAARISESRNAPAESLWRGSRRRVDGGPSPGLRRKRDSCGPASADSDSSSGLRPRVSPGGTWVFEPKRCARECAREHPAGSHNQPTLANPIDENPSASSQLTEGLLLALKLMKPLLCHLSYAAAPVGRAENLQAYGAGVKRASASEASLCPKLCP